MARQRNSFPATIVIIIMISSAICILSGLCTGWFAWGAETGRNASPLRHWYEAVIWGAMAFVPALLFLYIGLRQWRRGNNKTSGIILTTLGLIGTGGFAWVLLSLFSELRHLLRPSDRVDYTISISPYVYALLVISILVALSLWFVFVGLKIFFNTKKFTHTPETFD